MADTTFETNPLKLPWPQDKLGITQKLQREGCRAIGRMGADSKNYDMVMEVLQVLAKHAKAKLADQQAVKGKAAELAKSARADAAAVNEKTVAQQKTALQSQIDSLGKRMKALKARAAA